MDPTPQAVLFTTASFFLVSLFFAALVITCKRKKKSPTHQTRGLSLTRHTQYSDLNSIAIESSATFDQSLKHVSMAELVVATKNFSPDLIIGDGSFGLVYKAQLSNGVTVAIKKLDPDAFQGFREFRAEMETLGKLRHPNIVKILGYCAVGSDRVLIYEFIENGSLDQWVQESSSEEAGNVSSSHLSDFKLPLPWNIRVKVIRGVANGLSYLHNLDAPIIHRDIKASNVLLDSEFEAHIADFGLARRIEYQHSHVSTQVAGTMGYMPPEYREGITAARAQADVYSFGILMMEVATGHRPNLPVVFDGKVGGIVEWVTKMVGESKHMEMVDGNIWRDGLIDENVKEYFRIACMCTREMPKDRPIMSEVFSLLNQIST